MHPVDDGRVKSILTGLALAEHSGDVNDHLPGLCEVLGLTAPEWDDEYMRYVMAWEEREEY